MRSTSHCLLNLNLLLVVPRQIIYCASTNYFVAPYPQGSCLKVILPTPWVPSLFGSQSHLKATALGVPAAAIKRGIEAQRLRQELLGDGLGLYCCPRVRRGTLGQRFGAVLLPKRAVRHSWAMVWGCSVARGGRVLGVEGAMSGGNSSWQGYILSLKPARRVSGQKWKTEDISPAMQKPQSRH